MDKLSVVRGSVGLCAKIINLSENKHLIEYKLASENLLPLATFLSGFLSGLLTGWMLLIQFNCLSFGTVCKNVGACGI